MGKVVFATQDVSVHRSMGSTKVGKRERHRVTGVVLGVGDSMPLEDLPPYQREAVEAGKVAGLEVMEEEEAAKHAAALRSGVNPAHLNMRTSAFIGDDGSHSDHEVPDEVRRENLANEARSGLRRSREVTRGGEGEEGNLLGENEHGVGSVQDDSKK